MTRTGIAVVVALVASLVLVAIERRLRPGEGTVRWTRRVGVALTVLLVVGIMLLELLCWLGEMTLYRMNRVLTPEQRVKLKAMRDKRENSRRGSSDRRQ